VAWIAYRARLPFCQEQIMNTVPGKTERGATPHSSRVTPALPGPPALYDAAIGRLLPRMTGEVWREATRRGQDGPQPPPPCFAWSPSPASRRRSQGLPALRLAYRWTRDQSVAQRAQRGEPNVHNAPPHCRSRACVAFYAAARFRLPRVTDE